MMAGPRRREVQTGNTIHVTLAEKRTRRGTKTVFKVQKERPPRQSSRNSLIPLQQREDTGQAAWEDRDDILPHDSGDMAITSHVQKDKKVCI
jgi:hypothetical protein